MFYLLFTIIVKIFYFQIWSYFNQFTSLSILHFCQWFFSPFVFFISLHPVLYILYHLLLTATLSIIIWIIIIRFIITLFVHFSISTLNAARFFLATFEPSCWAFSTFAGIIWGEFVSIFQPMLLYSIPTNWPNQFIKSRFPLRI